MKKRYLIGCLSFTLAFLMLFSALNLPVLASVIRDPAANDGFDEGCGIHVYDQEVVEAKYKNSTATCTKPATYFYSCYCGAKGTSSFYHGETLPHSYTAAVMSDIYRVENSSGSDIEFYYSCACGAKGTKTFSVKSEDVIYTNPLEQYAGLEGDALTNLLRSEFATHPSTTAPVVQDGNTSLRVDVSLMISGTSYDVPLYAYSGYSKFSALGIVSYDAEQRTVTFSDETVLPLSGTPNNEAGYYGTFTYSDTKWTLCTGAYAAATQFGDGNNVDTPLNIYLPSISYTNLDVVYMEASYFISPDSKGTLESQLVNYTTNGASRDYLGLYSINLATGAMNRGGKLSIGQWNTVGMLLDLTTGKASFFIDGFLVAKDVALGFTNLAFERWSVAKIMKTGANTYGGSFYVDGVSVYDGDIADLLYSFKPYRNDFESYEENEVLSADTAFNALGTSDIVSVVEGDKAWRVDLTKNNYQNKLNLYAIDGAVLSSFVYEVDYYIPADAKFQVQTQLYNVTGIVDGVSSTKSFNDLYVLYSRNGVTEIKREGWGVGTGYALPTDEFFTVSVAVDLTTATYNVYVNKELALENQAFPLSASAKFSSLTWIDNFGIIIGKVNSDASSWASGYMYIDDIKVYEGSDKDVDGSIPASVTFQHSMQAFLRLESVVMLGVGYKIEGMEDIVPEDLLDRFGILIWKADALPAEAIYSNCDYIVEGAEYNEEAGRFEMIGNGIPAKNLGDQLAFRIFYRNDDGSYSYSRLIASYSPKTYCYNQINNNPGDTKLINLMVSILNYGAAAQVHFDYNKSNLMNSNLSDAQKAMTWDGSLVRSDYSVPGNKDSAFVRDAEITSRGGFLSLEGAIDYNYYAKVNFEAKSAKIYYWTESQIAELDALTLENASESEKLVWDAEDARWEGKYEGQPAKRIFNTVYACMVFEDAEGNTYYSGVIGYSPERYAYINQNKGDTNAELAKRLAVYGDAASDFFD